MATIIKESAFIWKGSHRGKGYATGTPVSVDVNIIPATIFAHCALSSVNATVDGPVGATIGFSKWTPVNRLAPRPPIDLGNDPQNWSPMIADTVSSFTISARVDKGDFRGCTFILAWA